MINHLSCQFCFSSDVQHYRPMFKTSDAREPYKTFHQFCGRCGKDLTATSVNKAAITRRSHSRRTVRVNSHKTLKGIMVLTTAFILTSAAIAFAISPEEMMYAGVMEAEIKVPAATVETIEEKITRISRAYDVDPKIIDRVIDCETNHTYDPKIQAAFVGTLGRERSFGLAQIHLTSHPEITYEQATDPDFAITFLAKNWKDHSHWWMCAKKLGLTK